MGKKGGLLSDTTLRVVVEVGAAYITLGDIRKLEQGSVIELDRNVGAPVDLFVGDQQVAEGALVTIDGHLGIRLTSAIATHRLPV